jgi:hypothetical protein
MQKDKIKNREPPFYLDNNGASGDEKKICYYYSELDIIKCKNNYTYMVAYVLGR